MGQTPVSDQQSLTAPQRSGSLTGRLLRAAEDGWLPDAAIRFGIRRLLRRRLRDLEASADRDVLTEFIDSAVTHPVALVPDKANDQHYEVPAAFFRQALGTHLKYSSGYWAVGIEDLDGAEAEALRRTCSHAGIRDGMDVLDLGCGWGSLSLWMSAHYPNCRITAVTNSKSQRDFIQRQADSRGLANLSVVASDMNDFEPLQRFDRVVSVEMFEHMRNHRELLHRIHDWLRPGGRLLVHIFCHRHSPYLFETDGDTNWMARNFFTGGMMPSADLLPKCGGPLSLVNQWKWNGKHYAKTCRAWLRNQDAGRESLRPVLARCYGEQDADRWHQRWRMFFMACEELFAFNGGNEWFVSHYLFERCPSN